MKYGWKKYLIVTGIISIFLALFIPETIEYIDLNYINPPNNFNSRIDINIYGLGWKLFYRTCLQFLH